MATSEIEQWWIDKFQENLGPIRKVAGWTTQQLADELGVARQTVSNLETGKSPMTKLQYLALRTVFSAEIARREDRDLARIIKTLVDDPIEQRIRERRAQEQDGEAVADDSSTQSSSQSTDKADGGHSSNGSGTDNANGTGGVGGTDGADGDNQDTVTDNPLKIVESGWSADQQGYVHYAFALRNTSKTQQVQYPQITITGRAKDGSIVFSQTQALNMAFPNQTVYDAGQAGEGTAPETVDFTVLNPDTYNVAKAQGTAAFPISGISKIDNRDGGTTFNGEVRAVADGFKPSDGQQIKISLVLRNAQNAIIYGDIAFVDWPGNGRSTPFSITVYDLPKYVSYDLYAQIW